MRKAISFCGWASVVFTIISLIFTLYSTYVVSYTPYFSSYHVLEICIFFTMVFWAVKLFDMNVGNKKYIHSVICLMFALVAGIFMIAKVY